MRAGQLCHRIQILEKTTTRRDAHGNPVDSWDSVAPVWAKVEPMDGGESQQQNKVTANVTHKITIRARPVSPHSRVLFNGRTFDVNRAIDLKELGQTTELYCTEAV